MKQQLGDRNDTARAPKFEGAFEADLFDLGRERRNAGYRAHPTTDAGSIFFCTYKPNQFGACVSVGNGETVEPQAVLLC